MIVFQTRPQNWPVMELYVPEILQGLIEAVSIPSSLDLEGPSFLRLAGTFGPWCLQVRGILTVFLGSPLWKVHCIFRPFV